ncbi:hypothetical protein TNCV_1010751 [Trichonephila clavipes]|nr:hypothetical protein TNCV_1010751 [Trichonephila clavipes]
MSGNKNLTASLSSSRNEICKNARSISAVIAIVFKRKEIIRWNMFGFKFSPDHIQSLRDGCPSSWELASKTMRIIVVRLSWRKTAWCGK